MSLTTLLQCIPCRRCTDTITTPMSLKRVPPLDACHRRSCFSPLRPSLGQRRALPSPPSSPGVASNYLPRPRSPFLFPFAAENHLRSNAATLPRRLATCRGCASSACRTSCRFRWRQGRPPPPTSRGLGCRRRTRRGEYRCEARARRPPRCSGWRWTWTGPAPCWSVSTTAAP